MARSQMLVSVLQALCLAVASHITAHFLSESVTSQWPDMAHMENYVPPRNQSDFDVQYTTFVPKDESSSPWMRDLLRMVLVEAVLLPLSYQWHLFLERQLPGRRTAPAEGHSTVPSEKVPLQQAGDGDAGEDEIIQRLVAQGRVSRPSLSWMNTFLKWLLDLSIGFVWRYFIRNLIEHATDGELWPRSVQSVAVDLTLQFLVSLTPPFPLIDLISMAVVPAYKRIVFEAGAGLVVTVFVGVLLRTFVPWLLKTNVMQEIFLSMRADAKKSLQAEYEGIFEGLNVTLDVAKQEL